MPSLAPSLPSEPTAPALPSFAGRSYARARLWLGIAAVGTQVVLAAAALLLGLPARWLPTDPAAPLGPTLLAVLGALLVPTAVLLPFDWLGGRVVVPGPEARTPVAAWARAVVVQLVVWLAAAAATIAAARAAGAPGALAAGVAAQLALLALRGPVARLAAALPALPATHPDAATIAGAAAQAGLAHPPRVVDARDHTFVGGWVGAGARSLWVPAHWAALPAPALVAQLVRRRATRDLGLHARGVALALAWNAAGLALVLGPLAVDVRTAAGAVAAVAWGVLWSFLGLLVLPTPSRRGVYRVDAAAARAVGGASTRDAILRLDAWQDAESRRAPGVEAIFHPVPAAGHRVAALAGAEAETAGAAHHAARHALYLAWAQGSPLARAVHCNVGRPALWVVWPGD